MKNSLSKAAPTILTIIGSAGVVLTAIASARATPKAIRLLAAAEQKKEEPLTVPDKIVTVAPAYVPAFVIGAFTIACLLGANVLSRRQQAALVSAYELARSSYDEYRGKLIELYGKETDEAVRDAIVRDHCDYHVIDSDVPEKKLLFYEEISGEKFYRYERDVIDAEYHLNRNFIMRGYASLNELYEFLGLPTTEYGESVGWSISDGYCWIDFSHRLLNKKDRGEPVYAIDMIFSPDSGYLREWE